MTTSLRAGFAGRLVDAVARRPSGPLGRLIYRFPLGHKPGFDLALAHLPPAPGAHAVDVGCGGGVFLRRALALGATATGIDHAEEMVAASARLNRRALAGGRLALHRADAAALPLEDACADRAYCLNAFFFFPDPQAAVAEMARILRPGGALAIVTAAPAMGDPIARLFPAMARAMRFDPPEALAGWCAAAGLAPRDPVPVPGTGYLLIADRPG